MSDRDQRDLLGAGDSITNGSKAYAKPQLKVFGQVGMLTQGGTGTMSENVMNPMNTMQRP